MEELGVILKGAHKYVQQDVRFLLDAWQKGLFRKLVKLRDHCH